MAIIGTYEILHEIYQSRLRCFDIMLRNICREHFKVHDVKFIGHSGQWILAILSIFSTLTYRHVDDFAIAQERGP